MKHDIRILQWYFCDLQADKPIRLIPGTDKEAEEILLELVKTVSPRTKAVSSCPESIQRLSQLSFSGFCRTVADEILKQEHPDILPGCGVFLWLMMDKENVFAFLKMNYQPGMPALSSAGNVELLLINMDTKSLKCICRIIG